MNHFNITLYYISIFSGLYGYGIGEGFNIEGSIQPGEINKLKTSTKRNV